MQPCRRCRGLLEQLIRRLISHFNGPESLLQLLTMSRIMGAISSTARVLSRSASMAVMKPCTISNMCTWPPKHKTPSTEYRPPLRGGAHTTECKREPAHPNGGVEGWKQRLQNADGGGSEGLSRVPVCCSGLGRGSSLLRGHRSVSAPRRAGTRSCTWEQAVKSPIQGSSAGRVQV